MTAWYLAPSLVRLRDEVDHAWPDRDRRSDGAIGDTAHSARTSEHNPDSKGCVHALDIDVDGVDPSLIVRAVVHHPAAWYVIWNRRIWSRTHAWIPRPYNGADPHTGHVHVSIELTTAAENSTASWGMPEPTQEEPMADVFDDPNSRAFNGQDRSRIQYAADRGKEAVAALTAVQTKLDAIAASVAALTGKPVDVDEQAIVDALLPYLQREDLDPAVIADQIVRALPDTIAKQVLDGLAQRLTPAGS